MSNRYYIITGVTFDNRRVAPIICHGEPNTHMGHLKSGTLWFVIHNKKYTKQYRHRIKRFVNSNYPDEQ